MSWLTIILVLVAIIMFIASSYRFDEFDGRRDAIQFIGYPILIIFLIFTLIYTTGHDVKIKIKEIHPTYYQQSKNKLYLEFDVRNNITYKDYTEKSKIEKIDTNTVFYDVESINMWGIHFHYIKDIFELPDVKKSELNKFIENR